MVKRACFFFVVTGEFLASSEKIPTNILAERLQRLESAGIISRAPYQQNPPRYAYTLTAKGHELKPVLGTVAQWGLRHLPKVNCIPSSRATLPAWGRPEQRPTQPAQAVPLIWAWTGGKPRPFFDHGLH